MPIKSLQRLHPEYRDIEILISRKVRNEGLPLVVYETKRSHKRQDELFARGSSKARGGQSPHNWGLAADRVLVPDSTFWAPKYRPKHPWDMGVDEDRTEIINPMVFEVWKQYGRLVRDAGARWGGLWKKPGQLIGWDPFHSQAHNWRKLKIRDGEWWNGVQ